MNFIIKSIPIFLILFLTISCEYNVLNKSNIEEKVKNEFTDEVYSSYQVIIVEPATDSCKIQIQTPYKYSHSDWALILSENILYRITKANLSEFLMNNDSLLYISVLYNFDDTDNEALFECKIPSSFNNYLNLKNYPEFAKYVINKMTPSDFQAYDWALKTLYEKTLDKKFNVTFYSFILKISRDDLLDSDEEFILDKLIEWAEERGEIEKPDHFIYFKSSLYKTSDEIEVAI